MYKLSLIFLSLLTLSCSSVSIKENISLNNNDWIVVGGDPSKTNISASNSPLQPPFTYYWDYNADAGFSKNSLSAADAILFAATLKGEMFALDMVTGKSLGKVSSLGKSSFCTPALFGNNAIVTFDGEEKKSIMSYNIKTGTENWVRDIGMVKSSPVVVDKDVFASSTNGKIYKINASTGDILWQFTGSAGAKKPFLSSPTFYKGVIYSGNANGDVYAVDAATGKELWIFKTRGPMNADISIHSDKLFFGSDDKNFYCLELSGTLLWKKDLGTKFISSSTFHENSVVTSAIDGKVYSMDINTGTINWQFTTKGTLWASPVINRGKIFIGSFDQNLYCLDASNGSLMWSSKLESRIRTTAVIWKEYIFVACDDKKIYCFK